MPLVNAGDDFMRQCRGPNCRCEIAVAPASSPENFTKMVQRRNKSHHVPVCFDVFKMLFCQGFWNTIGQRLLLSRLGLAARHYGHMPEITLTGPDTAEGIWYFQDWALHIPTNTVMDGNGIIHDHYRKEKGQWRICCYSYRCVVETVYP